MDKLMSDQDMQAAIYEHNRMTEKEIELANALVVTTNQKNRYFDALEKIAKAAVSSSPDAHYLGNVARNALGLPEIPKKGPRA